MKRKHSEMRLRLYRDFQLGGSLIPSLDTNLWLLPFLTGGKPGKSGYIYPIPPLIDNALRVYIPDTTKVYIPDDHSNKQ